MSKATRTEARPAITQVVMEARPAQVILELSVAEAQFLANVMSKVGGSPYLSARKYQDGISASLREVGVRFENQRDDTRNGMPTMPMTGSIFCTSSN